MQKDRNSFKHLYLVRLLNCQNKDFFREVRHSKLNKKKNTMLEVNDEQLTMFETLGWKHYLIYDKDEGEFYVEKCILKKLLSNKTQSLDYSSAIHSEDEVTIKKNISYLSSLLHLNQIEEQILFFVSLLWADSQLTILAESTPVRTIPEVYRVLSTLLGCDSQLIKEHLQLTSTLISTGMVALGEYPSNWGCLDSVQINPLLGNNILKNFASAEELYQVFINKNEFTNLSQSDFPHLKHESDLIVGYLESSKKKPKTGINILLYGEPGTGKTEYVKMLAQRCGLTLFEVDADIDDHLERSNRFHSYWLAQSLLKLNSEAIVLFDEVEDVFNQNSQGRGNKAWVNKILETNPRPTFWVTNYIDAIDNAFKRRFDFVIEFKTPPRSIRLKNLSHYLDSKVSKAYIEKLVDNRSLTPAIVARTTAVVSQIKSLENKAKVESAMTTLLSNTLKSMNKKSIAQNNVNKPKYLASVFNTTNDIKEICNGLKHLGEGRLCFYGPPGTGKTSLGHFIAEQVDKPILIYKASDILGMYIGQTERNIANMFESAANEDAVLLLDEADTFLYSREHAQRSWELSAVNEMLTQMESFVGIFIASTNLMDVIDSAALRRFDFKLKFDYLTESQALEMFKSVAKTYQLKVNKSIKYDLSTLHNLTPGDFHVLDRRLRFLPQVCCEDLIKILKEECAAKPEAKQRSIGFCS